MARKQIYRFDRWKQDLLTQFLRKDPETGQPLLKKLDEETDPRVAKVQWVNSDDNDARVAVRAEKTLGFPISRAQVAGTRQDLFGSLPRAILQKQDTERFDKLQANIEALAMLVAKLERHQSEIDRRLGEIPDAKVIREYLEKVNHLNERIDLFLEAAKPVSEGGARITPVKR